jgi:hypothetical protein
MSWLKEKPGRSAGCRRPTGVLLHEGDAHAARQEEEDESAPEARICAISAA